MEIPKIVMRVEVEGVKLELYNSNGDNIDSVSTDSNGEYLFCGVENGEYSIKIDKTTLPNGYLITELNLDENDSIDSDFDLENASVESVIVKDSNNTAIDGGIYKPKYCIGDFVWFDDNQNGIQDSSESGVVGVKIILNETNETTISNSSGYYEFCDLDDENYSITVDKSTLPDGYEITAQNQGDSDSLDSDIDPETAKK